MVIPPGDRILHTFIGGGVRCSAYPAGDYPNHEETAEALSRVNDVSAVHTCRCAPYRCRSTKNRISTITSSKKTFTSRIKGRCFCSVVCGGAAAAGGGGAAAGGGNAKAGGARC